MATKPDDNKILSLRIDQLLLDLQNPRLSDADSQHKALELMLRDQGPRLCNLADDIVENGLSPTDNLLVLKSDTGRGKYVALEGNRRLTALKLVSNPELLKSIDVPQGLRKRLTDAAKEFGAAYPDGFPAISCREMKTREEARNWLARRHGTQLAGVGIVPWGAMQSARFFKRDRLALDAIDLVKKYGKLSKAQLQDVMTQGFISTLVRLLRTREVRNLIGVEQVGNKPQDRELTSELPGPELLRPLRHMVIELTRTDADGKKVVSVSGLKKAKQMEDWVKDFGANLPNLATKTGDARNLRDYNDADFAQVLPGSASPSSGADANATTAPTSADASTQSPAPSGATTAVPPDGAGSATTAAPSTAPSMPAAGSRDAVSTPPASTSPVAAGNAAASAPATSAPKTTAADASGRPEPKAKPEKPRGTMVPPSATLNIDSNHERVRSIFGELKKINMQDLPNAVAVLFRVFFELSVDAYLKKHGLPLEHPTPKGLVHKKFQTKIKEVVAHMCDHGVQERDIRAVANMPSDKANPLHPDYLHAYVHDPHYAPMDFHLRTAWDNALPFFQKVWP